MAGKTKDPVLKVLNIGNGFVSMLAGLLAVVLILYSGYVLYDSFATEYGAITESRDLLKYKPVVLADGKAADNADDLAAVNKDYRAWLTVNGTAIDYPIVQGKDDVYYAMHDIYGNSSMSGAIYLAAANNAKFNDSYNVIFGHHMDNGAMFGTLDRFTDSEYFHAHQTGTLVTKKKVYNLTLFAVATTDAYENQIYDTGNRAAEVISFLTGPRDHDAGVGTKVLNYDKKAAKGATKVVALSTCTDTETNGRLVVFGKLEPADPQEVTLTVHYQLGDEEAFPTATYTYQDGETYYVVSPQLPGYTADIEIVQGTMNGDLEIYVHYIPKTWQMVIHYVYEDGTEAAEAYIATIVTGEQYSVASPEIPGYTAIPALVSGTNPGRSEEFTVVYVKKADHPKYRDIEDYGTPTGLDGLFAQIGICAE